MNAEQGDQDPSPPPPSASGPSGEGEDGGVTMLDVLEEEEALEEDCDAVLGGFSDSTCTYSLGYLPRQPLYACRDCVKEGEVQAGICLGCSYQCHEGCNLVELYTKRNFRCDCGSSKMRSQCKLEPGKLENSQNNYNQNFTGLYCTCSRPYPDPEDPVDDVMIQCVVCEDWLHGRHLVQDSDASSPPAEDLYAEMICYQCVGKFEFLKSYAGLSISQGGSKAGEEKEDVDVTADAGDSEATTDGAASLCKLKPGGEAGEAARSLFFPDKWRQNLCRCPACSDLYAARKICFLTEEEDTVIYYETRAKDKKKGTLEHGMEALSKMDRVKQVEAIHSYNNMKENLMEYLSKFANNKKVVREEDIREFFEGIKSNKKMKPGGAPPSSCK